MQGVPAQFYMEEHYLSDLRGMAGVAHATPQFFLASAHAGCCSVAVQLIGFDPASDQTIQPWIRESYGGTVGYGDILVGSGISVPADGMLTFYDLLPRRGASHADGNGDGYGGLYEYGDDPRDDGKCGEERL